MTKPKPETLASFVPPDEPPGDCIAPNAVPNVLGIGVWPGIPEPDYRTDPAVGHSDVRAWLNPRKLSRNTAVIGRATHTLLLEGRTALEEQFVTADCDFDLRTAEGKAKAAGLVGDTGKALLRHKERCLVERMATAVWGHPQARAILEAPGDAELTVIGKFPDFEQLYKCRIDLLRRASIWDLKTTNYVNEQQFRDAEVEYGYINQLEWYASLYSTLAGEWFPPGCICVSKREPNNVWLRLPTDIPNQLIAMAAKWRADMLTLYERYVPKEMRDAAKRHDQ